MFEVKNEIKKKQIRTHLFLLLILLPSFVSISIACRIPSSRTPFIGKVRRREKKRKIRRDQLPFLNFFFFF